MERAKLISIITDKLKSDKLILPTLPDVALSISKQLSDNNVNMDTLISQIQRDTALSARIIKYANTAAIRGHKPITSISQATIRIGLSPLKKIITAFAIEQVYFAKDIDIAIHLSNIWNNTRDIAIRTAAMSRLLSDDSKESVCENTLFLIALVHNIGALTILSEVDKQSVLKGEQNIDKGVLNSVTNAMSVTVTNRILSSWHFPTEIIYIATHWLSSPNPSTHKITYMDLLQGALASGGYLDTDFSKEILSHLELKNEKFNKDWYTSTQFISEMNELKKVF